MLTSREQEVVTLLSEGKPSREIASHLHISQATVKSHLVHIFGKLGVSDRTAAVTVALRHGLIQLDEDGG